VAQYSFGTRFENGIGTNPERTAGRCTCRLLCHGGFLASGQDRLEARKGGSDRNDNFPKVGEHFATTKNHLDLLAQVPSANQAKFDAAVNAAQTGRPVSRLSIDARLEVTSDAHHRRGNRLKFHP
jgi:osmotically inducible protein OsmC